MATVGSFFQIMVYNKMWRFVQVLETKGDTVKAAEIPVKESNGCWCAHIEDMSAEDARVMRVSRHRVFGTVLVEGGVMWNAVDRSDVDNFRHIPPK